MKVLRNILVNLCRLIVALTFILSGYVKSVDPLGTQYKIEDYLTAMGIVGGIPSWCTLGASVLLSTVEFCIGIMLLLAVRKRFAVWATFIFVVIMTFITIWIYVADPVSDCGCFGDAIHLTNGQSLLKNIILLMLVVVILLFPDKMVRFLSDSNSSIAFSYSILFIVGTALYCLYFLPLFDFRPYHIGVNIAEAMQIPENAEGTIYETTFIMEKNGTTKEFNLSHYPDTSWTFIDSKTTIVKEGYVPSIHDFTIQTMDGDDITDDVLSYEGYTFLLIAPYLDKADDSNFGPIDQIFEYAQNYGYPFYCLTSSTEKSIARWQDNTGAEYPFFLTDGTTLKTMLRSNPGLMLLKDGVIIQKWSHNNLPKEESLTAPLASLPIGVQEETSKTKKITEILLLFILPIVLLSITDRLWAWRQWLKKKRSNSSTFMSKGKEEHV